jgi:TfoX/Sxy family transcriptional regulator of competence genes
MAYDPHLAQRIAAALEIFPEAITKDIEEKKMFGGIAFLFKGKMTLGIVKGKLAVRVISDKMESVLDTKHVRPMDFTNKPMKEFVYVEPEGFKTEQQLHKWIELGLEHAQSKLN